MALKRSSNFICVAFDKMMFQITFLFVLFFSGFINAQVDIPYIQIDKTNDGKCNTTEYNLLPINCNQPIYPVVHGWGEGLTVQSYHKLIKELIAKNYNSYFVDWHNIAGNIIYPTVDVQFVGKCLGQYLNATIYQKCPKRYVYLTGHSLGAHVVGIAGKTLKTSGFLADVITGLDPAGPEFYFLERYIRLAPTDGKLVIHVRTNAYLFGIGEELGKVTLYANNGMSQNGCPSDPNMTDPIFCSHQRSIAYQTEAIISNNFVASKCDTFLGLIVKKYRNENIVYNLNLLFCYKQSYTLRKRKPLIVHVEYIIINVFLTCIILYNKLVDTARVDSVPIGQLANVA